MTNYDTKLKAIKDAYLDLGVAISELIKLPDAKPNHNWNRATGVKERIKNAMSNRPNQMINIYQMKEILVDFTLKSVCDGMRSVAKDGYITQVGVATYKREQ